MLSASPTTVVTPQLLRNVHDSGYPLTWKPPMITGKPAATNCNARSRPRGYWLVCTPARPIRTSTPSSVALSVIAWIVAPLIAPSTSSSHSTVSTNTFWVARRRL